MMTSDSGAGRGGRQRSNSNASAAGGPIVLGPNDSLTGTLRTESGVTVHGSVEGEIFATGDVVVEPSGTVRATVEGRNIDIRGQVTGNVTSAKRLSLSGSGTLQGDASAGRLVVEGGATLNGSISMSGGKDLDAGEDQGAGDAVEAEPEGELVPAGDH